MNAISRRKRLYMQYWLHSLVQNESFCLVLSWTSRSVLSWTSYVCMMMMTLKCAYVISVRIFCKMNLFLTHYSYVFPWLWQLQICSINSITEKFLLNLTAINTRCSKVQRKVKTRWSKSPRIKMLRSHLKDRFSIYKKSWCAELWPFWPSCGKNICRIQFIMLMVLNGYLTAI